MKKILKMIKNRVKLSTLMILLVLLIFNSYAWFVYATKVSTGFSAHVSSWNVQFETGEGEIVTNMEFNVERIYPGMKDYSQTLTVYNRGETEATLIYEIKSIIILGTEYEIEENMTTEQILEMIQNRFPFKIDIVVENANLTPESDRGSFTISVKWPFESGNDQLDTLWGESAYDFYNLNPNKECIEMNIQIKAIQT